MSAIEQTRTSGEPGADGAQAAAKPTFKVEVGRPHPLGADVDPNGVNFAVFSQNATAVERTWVGNNSDM